MPGGMKKKKEPEMYNMGGQTGNTMMPKAPMSKMYQKGGKLYMGGGGTMMTDKTPSFKDDMQRRFGGGGMTGPSMKKNK